ncbi:MAG: hypothetical protein WCG32_03385, partial [Actinomycetes bacterium]
GQGGIQKGATLTFKQMLKLLPKKMDNFATLVKATTPPAFEKGSPGYVSVFPHGMEDFGTNQTIDNRMDALTGVSTAMGTFTALASVKTTFDAYLLTLTDAQSNQESNMGATGTDSDVLKVAVEDAMVGLYAFMGAGINKFKVDATVLESLFDMRTLRHHRQVRFTGTLDGDEIYNIMEHTFDDFDDVELTAQDTKQSFYLALNPFDGPAGYTLITVDANTTRIIDASEFTNTATNRFLCVVNTETTEGHFVVKL